MGHCVMKVLITGAAGFIGSHLTEFLVEAGHDVVAFDRYNSDGTFGWLDTSHVKSDVNKVFGDIRDQDSVFGAMAGCDRVFHLAALIGIPYSYVSPQAYVQTNILGTLNVLQSAKNLGVERVINTSTSETYGSAQFVPMAENHPKVGQSPYSASKIAADALAESFKLSFGMDIRTVRPFNTYGPRQSLRAVVPQIITQCLSDSTDVSLGDITTIRDMVFVEDTVNGFWRLSEVDSWQSYDAVNICTGTGLSIEEIAHKIFKICDVEKPIVTDTQRLRPQGSEVTKLIGDNKRLKSLVDWSPTTPIEDGLHRLRDWVLERGTEDLGYRI